MHQLKYLMIFSLLIILTGCIPWKQFSPEQVIEKTLNTVEQNQLNYYGEMKIEGMGLLAPEINESGTIKQWTNGDKVRVEVYTGADIEPTSISVINDQVFKLYDVNEKVVIETDVDHPQEFYTPPKEQMNEFLALLRDTHHIEQVDKEKIANRPTIHLKAQVKPYKKSLFGDIDLWIDRENWIVLKLVIKNDDTLMRMEYTTIDFQANFEPETFQLDVPEDVTVEQIDGSTNDTEITLEEIPNFLNRPVHVIPEDEHWKIDSITHTGLTSMLQMVEINYTQDGLPTLIFLIARIDDVDDSVQEQSLEILEDVSTEVDIKGVKGYFIEFNEIKMLTWMEDDLEYTLQFVNPSLQLTEVITLVENMIEMNNESK